MITWGLVSGAFVFVNSETMFYVMRFLLGVAEAGFFPGIILYVTYWYPSARRAKIVSLFMTAIPLSGVLGGPLSGWIMDFWGLAMDVPDRSHSRHHRGHCHFHLP
jgi:MFS family permease